jgi:thioredoxin 1
MIKLENDDLKTLLSDSTKPVLVDFYGDWCSPCKMIEPAIEEIANEFQNIEVIKVDVDINPNSVVAFGIRSVPTLIVFKAGGEIIKKQSGAMPKNRIVSDMLKGVI